MKKKFLYLMILILLVVGLTACQSASPTAEPTKEEAVAEEPTKEAEEEIVEESAEEEKEPIYLAAIYPMTGDNALFGEIEVQAHNYVIDKVNESGGINGREIKLEVFDDRGDPQEGANIAQKVANDPKFLAGFGHFRSVVTLAASPIYDEAGFLFLTDSINTKISCISPWVFRYSITNEEAGKQLVWAAIKNNPEYETAAIIYSQTDFAVGQMETTKVELEKLGVELVANESYFEGQSKDFTPQLTKIKQADPDVIFAMSYYAEAAAIVQQARDLGMEQTFWGPDGLNNRGLIELGGEAVEGVHVVSYFSEDASYPNVSEVVAEYEEKWDVKPDGISAITLDATQLVVNGMQEVGPDRDALKEWLSTQKGFVGIAGPIEFDDCNDNLRRIVVIKVEGGKFVEAEAQVPEEYFETEFGQ
jgi:branched-chain amino acid transport system substrate-binding protein